MGRSQVTLSSNTPHGAPLERGNLDTSCSIDIALRWSENQTTKLHFSRLVIERKRSVACGKNYSDRDNGVLSSNTRHCTPLECENLDISYSIDTEDFYRTHYSFVWSSGVRKCGHNRFLLTLKISMGALWDSYRAHYPFAWSFVIHSVDHSLSLTTVLIDIPNRCSI